jgi:hypothetical protein
MLSCPAHGQTFTPYSVFQGLPASQLETLQGKIAQVGGSLRVIRSLGFTAVGHTFTPTAFSPYYRPQFSQDYAGDISNPHTFTATTALLKAMIDSIGTLPGVTDGGVDSSGYVSFALLQTSGDTTRVFEAIVDTVNGRPLFEKLFHAFQSNAPAVTELTNLGCTLGMLSPTLPNDATAGTTIRLRGVRRDRATDEYVGTIRVTNSTGQALAAPLMLVLRAEGNVDLANADGHTCRIDPAGAAILTLPVGASLAAGAHVDVTARFTNPDAEQIKFVVARVYSGTGTQ